MGFVWCLNWLTIFPKLFYLKVIIKGIFNENASRCQIQGFSGFTVDCKYYRIVNNLNFLDICNTSMYLPFVSVQRAWRDMWRICITSSQQGHPIWELPCLWTVCLTLIHLFPKEMHKLWVVEEIECEIVFYLVVQSKPVTWTKCGNNMQQWLNWLQFIGFINMRVQRRSYYWFCAWYETWIFSMGFFNNIAVHEVSVGAKLAVEIPVSQTFI